MTSGAPNDRRLHIILQPEGRVLLPFLFGPVLQTALSASWHRTGGQNHRCPDVHALGAPVPGSAACGVRSSRWRGPTPLRRSRLALQGGGKAGAEACTSSPSLHSRNAAGCHDAGAAGAGQSQGRRGGEKGAEGGLARQTLRLPRRQGIRCPLSCALHGGQQQQQQWQQTVVARAVVRGCQRRAAQNSPLAHARGPSHRRRAAAPVGVRVEHPERGGDGAGGRGGGRQAAGGRAGLAGADHRAGRGECRPEAARAGAHRRLRRRRKAAAADA